MGTEGQVASRQSLFSWLNKSPREDL
jgi:hypothetical protein